MNKHTGRRSAILAVLFFGVLAGIPWLFQGSAPPPWVQAAQSIAPVQLPENPPDLPQVKLSSVATPTQPSDPPAVQPPADATHMAALVAGEDNRLRTLLHRSNRQGASSILVVPGSVPTLVLTARPNPYTLADLATARVVVPLHDVGSYFLVASVLVRPGATLQLGGGDGLTTLLMNSSATGFTSLVTWGGTLGLFGESVQKPLTITGWDSVNNQPAENLGYGRPYIRTVGGLLDIKNARISNLGFWSGRTGGVAWTGVNQRPASGSAASSTFTSNTYGVFVSRSDGVKFTNDLFEGNELDGLRLHKNANNATITSSAAARNGANGFVVSRGAVGNALHGDVAIHNAGNGFLLNGQPLVNGASPSGDTTAASIGTVVEFGDAEGNARTGILVEGGAGTIVRNNIVCGVNTAMAVRSGATATTVVGNQIRCGNRVALSIGPAVTGTTVAGNRFESARIGLLVRNSPGIRILNNRFNGISVFGISIRGTSPGVVGNDNVITGVGFQPIDVRGGAPNPQLTSTNTKGWVHSSVVTVLSYLRFHPLLTTWAAILMLVAVSMIVVRLRRRPIRPYEHTVPWQRLEPATINLVGQSTPVLASERLAPDVVALDGLAHGGLAQDTRVQEQQADSRPQVAAALSGHTQDRTSRAAPVAPPANGHAQEAVPSNGHAAEPVAANGNAPAPEPVAPNGHTPEPVPQRSQPTEPVATNGQTADAQPLAGPPLAAPRAAPRTSARPVSQRPVAPPPPPAAPPPVAPPHNGDTPEAVAPSGQATRPVAKTEPTPMTPPSEPDNGEVGDDELARQSVEMAL
jgi:hypothetical protein